jgi:predicted PurR-regulated permease PerM
MVGHVTLVVVLAFALYICWLIVQPFVNVLLWATVLTVVFYPLHRRIRLGVRQAEAAAALSTLLVIVLILIPVTFVTIAIVRELRDVADMLQANVQQFGGPMVPGLGFVLDRLDGYVDIDAAAA